MATTDSSPPSEVSPTRPLAGAVMTSLGTLVSRVLGLVRDMATASLLGMAYGGVMDALVIAFRIPNLFRSLLGEGALSACYLPVFTAEWHRDRRAAWQLASVVLGRLTAVLLALVLLGEAIYAIIWVGSPTDSPARLLAGLGATLLPYMLLICVTAQLAATLYALRHFAAPAIAPTLLNLCWLAAVWFVAPAFSEGSQQAYVIAASILVAGAAQLALHVPPLVRRGFRFDYRPAEVAVPARQIARRMLPMVLGLGVTQINALLDSMIAWGLAAEVSGRLLIPSIALRYPLRQGAAAAIYYGERMYWLPLGLVGMAVATAIFPVLSAHAARGERDKLGADLTAGLRLVLALGVPAGVGLVLLASPLTQLLFEHGAFTPDDGDRTARVVAAYGLGVWAFCATPVLARGFFALGDYLTPAKVALGIVWLNLALNLSLVWPFAEAGLALATSISAALQVATLAILFSRRHSALGLRPLAATLVRTAVATAAMIAVAEQVAMPRAMDLKGEIIAVASPLFFGGAVYLAVFVLLGGRRELTWRR